MTNQPPTSERRPRFSLRGLFGIMLVVALCFGWYSSTQFAKRETQRLQRLLSYLDNEANFGKMRAEIVKVTEKAQVESGGNGFSGAQLDGENLQDIKIIGGTFQGTNFSSCNLRGATLTGGVSSFQGARFVNANLVNAKLTGDVSSFQAASFENADLTNAVLTGAGPAFQGATFQGAKLIGTQILCGGPAFQAVNIDGAQFSGADLSVIDRLALASCAFKTPPTYDDKTR